MTRYWQLGSWKVALASSLFFCGAIALSSDCAFAQITPDTTLNSENSTVTSTGAVDQIDGGAARGANLFHSFQEFNVGEGRAAVFTNPAGIENILTRVTGANRSNIFGTLGVSGGNANLFLINPNGIVFGAFARLNIGGSFVASTANALQFGNIGFFSATDQNTPSPLLTINPSALLFNQINQTAAIQNNSVASARTDPAGLNANGLRVADGKSLLLVGNNVSMDGGRLNAYGGRVELGGLAEPGSVVLGFDGDRFSLKFPENVTQASVSLTNQAGIYVPGAGGGNIAVNANNLEILGGSVLSAGIGQGLGTPETVAGDITLNATGEILVAGTGSNVRNLVRLGSLGNGGNITIDSGSFLLQNGAQIAAATLGQGNAGNVTVSASYAVSLADANIYSRVEEGSVGKGGNIDINAQTLSLTNGAQVQSVNLGQGNAGNVRIIASGNISFDSLGAEEAGSGVLTTVGPTGVGNGGDIYIQSSSLSLTNGGELVAGVFQGGQGNSGNVTVNVKNSINISGSNTNKGGYSSGIFTDPEENSTGKGGEMLLSADTLEISDGGILSARTRNAFRGGNIIVDVNSLALTGGGQILAAAFDQGNAGDITINATKGITISGSDPTFDARLAQFGRPFVDPINSLSGLFANTDVNSIGQGGSIKITTGQLQVENQAQVTVSSAGVGVAGKLDIAANSVKLNNGSITAQTRGGNGGDLTLGVKDLLFLRNSSQISTTAGTAQQPGNGGNITINTPSGFIVAFPSENSDITANAFTGRGGRVEIDAQSIFGIQRRSQLTPQNDITASSELGISGTLEINTLEVDPTQGVVELPAQLVDASNSIATGCTDGGENKFIITGRGGLPDNPSQSLGSDAIDVDLVTLNPEVENHFSPPVSTNPTSPTPDPIVEATSWVIDSNGFIVLTASAPSATPNKPWQTPANCHASKTSS